MSMIWMTHSGVVGVVQVDQQAFNDIWSAHGWTSVAGPASDPGVRTVLAKGDIADGQVPVYDAATGYYIPQTPVTAGLPTGGTDGQVLVKNTGAGGGVAWANAPTATPGPPGDPGRPGRDGKDATATAGRWG